VILALRIVSLPSRLENLIYCLRCQRAQGNKNVMAEEKMEAFHRNGTEGL
jgi:hypothetical protein